MLRYTLKDINYCGHISIRRKLFQETQYIGGGTSEDLIDRYGGYRVEYIEVIDNVLIIYVNYEKTDIKNYRIEVVF